MNNSLVSSSHTSYRTVLILDMAIMNPTMRLRLVRGYYYSVHSRRYHLFYTALNRWMRRLMTQRLLKRLCSGRLSNAINTMICYLCFERRFKQRLACFIRSLKQIILYYVRNNIRQEWITEVIRHLVKWLIRISGMATVILLLNFPMMVLIGVLVTIIAA